MYHHHHGKNNILATRTAFPPDRHLFMQGVNIPKDTGLVLSTDAKPRLKWTPELHERFIEAVNQLGGAQKATPKTIMRLMAVPGLTLYHLKSHLQKYRLSRNLQAQASQGPNKNGSTVFVERLPAISGTPTNSTNAFQTNSNLQINEALEMQIEVQRRLHEQLEVQRHLQLRIEAQGKYLQSVLEKAEETLGKQNLGSEGLEAAKVQLSELVSKVSHGGINSTFPALKELTALNSLQTQKNQLADSSVDSCLTSCDGAQKDHGIMIRLRTYYDDSPLYTNQTGQNKLHQIQPMWVDPLNECRTSVANDPERTIFPSQREFRGPEKTILPLQRDSRYLSLNNSIEGDKGSDVTIFEVRKKREIETLFFEQPNSKRTAFQQERENQGQAGVMTELDLNSSDENDAASIFK